MCKRISPRAPGANFSNKTIVVLLIVAFFVFPFLSTQAQVVRWSPPCIRGFNNVRATCTGWVVCDNFFTRTTINGSMSVYHTCPGYSVHNSASVYPQVNRAGIGADGLTQLGSGGGPVLTYRYTKVSCLGVKTVNTGTVSQCPSAPSSTGDLTDFFLVGAPTPGTCQGLDDWESYPVSGCITGLLFGGPCTRSSAFQSKCDSYEEESCSCNGGFMSPIVVDVDHSGFSMTDAAGGVVFDFLNDGVPLAISWTAHGSTNAFLVLDRNGDGTINNGEELFGDVTPQPASSEPNGFLALAEYDKAGSGGNGNGSIDRNDAIFSELQLWQDFNHNGISEFNELQPLAALVRGIDLDYKESKRKDQYGNEFRYRAKVFDVNGEHAGRWAWDVFLTVQ